MDSSVDLQYKYKSMYSSIISLATNVQKYLIYTTQYQYNKHSMEYL